MGLSKHGSKKLSTDFASAEQVQLFFIRPGGRQCVFIPCALCHGAVYS